jgi:hypothetical protein
MPPKIKFFIMGEHVNKMDEKVIQTPHTQNCIFFGGHMDFAARVHPNRLSQPKLRWHFKRKYIVASYIYRCI